MPPTAPRVWLTTLGCAKNQVDSDKVTALLAESGYAAAPSPEDADVVMVNTCAFIEAARQESIDTILEMADTKRPDARLVVLGCMAQRYETELVEALPEADAVIGLERYGELVGRLDGLTRGTVDGWAPIRIAPARTSPLDMDILHRVERPTPTTPFAYVKVAEGCDKPCTFCAIPTFRGKQRSRAPMSIRSEIAALTAAGVSEVVLVAQDLAAFGRDLFATPPPEAAGGIADLLRFVSDVDGLRRLRLYYLYPREIRPELIEVMATSPVVADYFDLSLQHATGRLLRAMKRPGSGEAHLALIESIRTAAPGAALRSSFIVGFPGETEDDVDELAGFLAAADLDWAGFFPYSAEEGTAAADLDGRIDDDEVGERLRHLQVIQEDITAARNAAEVGRVLDVLVDQVEDGTPVGRSYRQAPEIDGVILLDGGTPGQWVRAEMVAAYGTDLTATVVGPA
jgi:ribosomal protein S12 methylthiotransferase